MIKDVITMLCRQKDMTISALEKELGFSNYAIAKWDKSVPRIDSVKKVADYFDVSVDFLLGDNDIYDYIEYEENKRFQQQPVQERRREQRRATDNDAALILGELQAIIKNYLPQDNKKIPVVGTIKCGPNGIAYEDIDDYIMIDESLHGDFLALRTRGDSMTGAGIDDGDLAIIRLQDDVESGEIAAVLIGEEATLKRVIKSPIGIALEGASPSYKTRYFTGEEANSIRIIGKLVEIRKRF